MKRLALSACLAAAVLGGPSFAHAAPTVLTGSALVGNTATYSGAPGVTEALAACSPDDADFNGIDGQWFSVADYAGMSATLRATDGNASVQDVDAYFYTASCDYIDDMAFAQNLPGDPEAGVIPSDAGFVCVDLSVGANATFELSIADA